MQTVHRPSNQVIPRPPAEDGEPIPKLALSVDHAGTALGVSGRTVWTLTQRGELGYLKIGSRRLIPISELNRYIASRQIGGAR
jgi:excisionase family DNA binding protein